MMHDSLIIANLIEAKSAATLTISPLGRLLDSSKGIGRLWSRLAPFSQARIARCLAETKEAWQQKIPHVKALAKRYVNGDRSVRNELSAWILASPKKSDKELTHIKRLLQFEDRLGHSIKLPFNAARFAGWIDERLIGVRKTVRAFQAFPEGIEYLRALKESGCQTLSQTDPKRSAPPPSATFTRMGKHAADLQLEQMQLKSCNPFHLPLATQMVLGPKQEWALFPGLMPLTNVSNHPAYETLFNEIIRHARFWVSIRRFPDPLDALAADSAGLLTLTAPVQMQRLNSVILENWLYRCFQGDMYAYRTAVNKIDLDMDPGFRFMRKLAKKALAKEPFDAGSIGFWDQVDHPEVKKSLELFYQEMLLEPDLEMIRKRFGIKVSSQ